MGTWAILYAYAVGEKLKAPICKGPEFPVVVGCRDTTKKQHVNAFVCWTCVTCAK